MQSDAAQMEFSIQGMTCSVCSTRLEKMLRRAVGVQQALVNFATEKAAVRFDAATTSIATLVDVVERTGFSVGTDQVAIQVEGLHSDADARCISAALGQVHGVVASSIEMGAGQINVTVVAGSTQVRDLVVAVSAAGFTADMPSAELADAETLQRMHDDARLDADRRTLKISIALTVPLVLQMILQFAGYDDSHVGPELEVLLATPVQFLIGARFYKAAWNALRGGSANMDVLVVMGTTAAYLYSWYLIYSLGPEAEGELYFEASAVIITLVLLGKYLEAKARRRTTEAIRQLMDLRPETARVKQANGLVVEVPVAEVGRGDSVIIRPGERIPVDGEVLSGSSELDESLITGESLPVLRQAGDAVTGGAINISGLLEVRATRVGQDSMLAKIIRMVADAQVGKAAIQRLVDRVSAVFVPVVIGIAAVTFVYIFSAGGNFEAALVASVAVLVIACPCALGLATPTAIMTGTGAAARAGILIRDVDTLERAATLDTVAFDKTGTLTLGKPVVVDVHCPAQDENSVLQYVVSVQQGSEHPLAHAFLSLAMQRDLEPLPVEEFRSVVGQGVRGLVAGHTIVIGSQAFIAAEIELPPQLTERAWAWEEQARTVVWVAVDGVAVALFAMLDPLRVQSRAAVESLHAAGIQTLLLSGDSDRAAASIGRAAGVEDARGKLRPDEKAALVQALMADGCCVAMVGDGINDAPALAAADVGIAMGSGTDIAMETAGITLMRPDPRLVKAAVDVSRAMLRKIRQNLFWAFVYNVVGIPLAAAGYLSPTLAAAAMAMSSVSVVSNSLLLRRWQPDFTGQDSLAVLEPLKSGER
jgi:Cu+-exporting ATPase